MQGQSCNKDDPCVVKIWSTTLLHTLLVQHLFHHPVIKPDIRVHEGYRTRLNFSKTICGMKIFSTILRNVLGLVIILMVLVIYFMSARHECRSQERSCMDPFRSKGLCNRSRQEPGLIALTNSLKIEKKKSKLEMQILKSISFQWTTTESHCCH